MVAVMLVIIGLLILALGAAPLLTSLGILPFTFLTEGIIYPIILIAAGALLLIMCIKSMSMMGTSKFLGVVLSALAVVLGLMPFIGSVLPITIEGVLYYGVVCAVGLIGIIAGFMIMA